MVSLPVSSNLTLKLTLNFYFFTRPFHQSHIGFFFHFYMNTLPLVITLFRPVIKILMKKSQNEKLPPAVSWCCDSMQGVTFNSRDGGFTVCHDRWSGRFVPVAVMQWSMIFSVCCVRFYVGPAA